MSERTTGEIINFINGGHVRIHFVDDGWVFFGVWKPAGSDVDLVRMTEDDFEASVSLTESKLIGV